MIEDDDDYSNCDLAKWWYVLHQNRPSELLNDQRKMKALKCSLFVNKFHSITAAA